MNLRNIAIIFVFIVSLSFAEENNKKEDGIKIYKRLIPADVLRGKFIRIKIDVKKKDQRSNADTKSYISIFSYITAL